MVTNEEYLKQIKLELHSLLCVEKNPITPAKLHRNYREMMSTYICWVRLGYRNLDSLLKSMPDVVHCFYDNGVLLVKAVPLKESQHISELVAGQKPAKTNSKKHFNQNNNGRSLPTQNRNMQHNGLLPNPAYFNSIPKQPNFNSNISKDNQPSQAMTSQGNGPPNFNHTNNQNQAIGSNTYRPEQIQESVLASEQEVKKFTHAGQGYQPSHQFEEPRPVSVASNQSKPAFDVEKFKRIIKQKTMISQETSTEPIYQRDQETQTQEIAPLNTNCHSQLSSRFAQLSMVDQDTRQVLSRASTEPSVSLPTLSYSISPTRSHVSHMTSISRLGDTTFVRVVPSDPPMLNKSFQSTITDYSARRTLHRQPDESNLQHLSNMSRSGLVGQVTARHLRMPNGRYRAFILVDEMEFTNEPIDFVEYTDAYEEAARRACLYFGNCS